MEEKINAGRLNDAHYGALDGALDPRSMRLRLQDRILALLAEVALPYVKVKLDRLYVYVYVCVCVTCAYTCTCGSAPTHTHTHARAHTHTYQV